MILDSPPPIFLLASERSGTNLLRKLFSQHQKVYLGPSPAHFLKWLYYRRRVYGCLQSDENLGRLIKDSIDLCKIHFSPWEMEMDQSKILVKIREAIANPTVVLVTHYIQLMYARENDRASYFSKDNNLFDFPYLLLREIPNAKFVFLHRDPRDVVLSQKKRTLQSGDIAFLSKLWQEEQKKSIAAWQYLGPENCFRLSYEQLITDTPDTLEKLCAFAGCEYFEEPDSDYRAASGESEEWAQLNQPVLSKNHGKYLNELKRRDLRIIESICGPTMSALDYKKIGRRSASWIDYQVNHCVSKVYRLKRRFKKHDSKNEWNLERKKLLKRLSMYASEHDV